MMNTSREQELQRLREMSDDEIDFSDIPEVDEKFWTNARIVPPKNKETLTIRVDADVLSWFKDQGKGYQTHINSVLRSYFQHHNSVDIEEKDEAA